MAVDWYVFMLCTSGLSFSKNKIEILRRPLIRRDKNVSILNNFLWRTFLWTLCVLEKVSWHWHRQLFYLIFFFSPFSQSTRFRRVTLNELPNSSFVFYFANIAHENNIDIFILHEYLHFNLFGFFYIRYDKTKQLTPFPNIYMSIHIWIWYW